MNEIPSRRFAQFIWFRCRTINTGGRFLDPEWAEKAFRMCNSFKDSPQDNKPVETDGKYQALLMGMLFKPLNDMKDYRGS